MSLQMRIPAGQETKLYNPAGDVVHNLEPVMRELLRRCRPGEWDALELTVDKALARLPAAKRHKAVGEALNAMARYLATPPTPGDTMQGCLEAAGWFDCEPVAQVAAMALLGTVQLGVFHDRIREATLGGVGPVLRPEQLAEAGMACYRLFTLPRWRRVLGGLLGRVRGRR